MHYIIRNGQHSPDNRGRGGRGGVCPNGSHTVLNLLLAIYTEAKIKHLQLCITLYYNTLYEYENNICPQRI